MRSKSFCIHITCGCCFKFSSSLVLLVFVLMVGWRIYVGEKLIILYPYYVLGFCFKVRSLLILLFVLWGGKSMCTRSLAISSFQLLSTNEINCIEGRILAFCLSDLTQFPQNWSFIYNPCSCGIIIFIFVEYT